MKNFVRTHAAAAALLATGAACAQAPATPSPWWLHVGPVNVKFSPDATIRLGGAVVPGADLEASSSTTLGLEVGYDLSPNLSARLTVGLPPTTRLTGTGPLAGAGELGRLKYGPAVMTLAWRFDGLGAVKPYVGAGINYTIVLASKDGVVTTLDAKSAFGSVLQAGVDVPIDGRWGVFFDVKKVFLKTTASGFVGANAATASTRLDPLLVHAGVGFRF